MLDIEKIFITHYSPLVDRKKRLETILSQFENESIFIEDEPSSKDINNFFSLTKNEWIKKTEKINYGSKIEYKILTKTEISIAFKHLKAFECIVKNKIKKSLILEDDVILINNFEKNFNNSLEKTPNDWQFIFIGSGCDLKIPTNQLIKNKIAYEKKTPATRCCDSYIITYDAAKQMYDCLNKKITLPIDFELNYHIDNCVLKTYWWHPNVVVQGSQCGFFKSEVIK